MKKLIVYALILAVSLGMIPGSTASAACTHTPGRVEITATCMEEGEKRTYCAFCGELYLTEPMASLDHSFGEPYVQKAATCTERGIAAQDCNRCPFSIMVPISALGHIASGMGITHVQPTCTEPGKDMDHCTRCGAVLETAKEQALGHSFDNEMYDPIPSCETNGKRYGHCSRCNSWILKETLPALGHSYGAYKSNSNGTHSRTCGSCSKTETVSCTYMNNVVSNTCTTDGYTMHACTTCGYSYRDAYIQAGHRWSIWVSDSAGRHYRNCQACSAHEEQNCVYKNDGVTLPTCTAQGYTTYTCVLCRYSYHTLFTNATGHQFDRWISIADGKHSRKCYACKTVETADCIYSSIVTPPTCTAGGYTVNTCTVCGNTLRSNETQAGHQYGSWVHNASTSGSAATHTRTCSSCGNAQTQACTFTERTVPATCTANGYTEHTCTVCGYEWRNNEITTMGHRYGAWVHNASTSGSTAKHTRTCSFCGDTQPQACSFTERTVPATCTANGYTEHTCTVCGYEWRNNEIVTMGHRYGVWIYNTGTSGSTAAHSRTCSFCGDTQTQACIFTERTIPATCTANGYTERTCASCGYTWQNNEVPTMGHRYGVWIHNTSTSDSAATHLRTCSVCGDTQSQACSFTDEVVYATCMANGYTKHTCASCGYTWRNNEVPTMGHRYGAWTHDTGTSGSIATHLRTCSFCGDIQTQACSFSVITIPATCTTNGYTKHTCASCGYEWRNNEIVTMGHRYGAWIHDAGTTGSAATHLRTCSFCGDIQTQACTFTEKTVPATCTADGYTEHTCASCGYEWRNNEIVTMGHRYGAWTHDTGTSGSTATHLRTCSFCGDIQTKACTFTEKTASATCTADGYTEHTCASCGYEWRNNEVPTMGHRYGAWIHDAGTTGSAATHLRTCSFCGDTQTKACSFTDEVVPATCTADGYTEHTCASCGYAWREHETQATGHSFDNWAHVDGTTGSHSMHARYCSAGDVSQMEACIPGEWEITMPPCTRKGERVKRCVTCGFILAKEILPVSGHDFEWEIIREATCANEGLRIQKCVACGKVIGRATPYTVPHHIEWVIIKEAIERKAGLRVLTCTECGKAFGRPVPYRLTNHFPKRLPRIFEHLMPW